MHEVIVRAEAPEDVKAIDVVNLSAFQGESEARLVSAIRASAEFIPDLSLVAEINGRIVGHLLLSKVKLQRNGNSQPCWRSGQCRWCRRSRIAVSVRP
jgi:putative acetyltransferase